MPGIHYVNVLFDEDGAGRKMPGNSADIFKLPKTGRYYQHYLWNSFYDDRKTCFVCGIDSPPPEYALIDRSNSDNMINIVLDGEGTLNGQSFRRGQFFTIPAHTKNTMKNSREHPWTLGWFSWRGTLPKYFARIFDSYQSMVIYDMRNTDSIRLLFDALLYCDTHSADAAELINSFSRMVLSFLEKPEVAEEVRSPQTLSHTISYVEKAKILIARKYATITISELSETLHLNCKYLSRIFVRGTGMTPQNYLIEPRLNCSEFYLMETDYSIDQIAGFCGYTSTSSFIQAFRKKFGLSPPLLSEIIPAGKHRSRKRMIPDADYTLRKPDRPFGMSLFDLNLSYLFIGSLHFLSEQSKI